MDTELLKLHFLNYFSQIILGLSFFLIFLYFSKIYSRKFLKTWSWSWLACFVYLCAALSVIPFYGSFSWLRFLLSFIAQGGSFLFIALILVGTYELVNNYELKQKHLFIVLSATVSFALITVLLYSGDPNASFQRILFRSTLRSTLLGCGFIAAGLLIARNKKLTSGLGQIMLSVSFIAYGLQQLCLVIIDFYIPDLKTTVLHNFGLIDLLLLSLLGISMVMWLMEDEREKLKKTNKELDSFLYSTSHDLRAPIASILGLTNLAKHELNDSKGLELMGMIEKRVQKLDEVISDILNLARSKKKEITIKQVSLNSLIDEVVADVKFASDAPSIRLVFDRSANFTFLSDFSIMKTVLGNLFSNGVKYHRIDQADPYIAVYFKTLPNNMVVIEVEDNGQGIAPESLSKIFDMFYRASTSSDGSGLGLYIVKEALARINGAIEVKSTLNNGTKFSVTLNQSV